MSLYVETKSQYFGCLIAVSMLSLSRILDQPFLFLGSQAELEQGILTLH